MDQHIDITFETKLYRRRKLHNEKLAKQKLLVRYSDEQILGLSLNYALNGGMMKTLDLPAKKISVSSQGTIKANFLRTSTQLRQEIEKKTFNLEERYKPRNYYKLYQTKPPWQIKYFYPFKERGPTRSRGTNKTACKEANAMRNKVSLDEKLSNKKICRDVIKYGIYY